jgi:hypothetical protein
MWFTGKGAMAVPVNGAHRAAQLRFARGLAGENVPASRQ